MKNTIRTRRCVGERQGFSRQCRLAEGRGEAYRAPCPCARVFEWSLRAGRLDAWQKKRDAVRSRLACILRSSAIRLALVTWYLWMFGARETRDGSYARRPRWRASSARRRGRASRPRHQLTRSPLYPTTGLPPQPDPRPPSPPSTMACAPSPPPAPILHSALTAQSSIGSLSVVPDATVLLPGALTPQAPLSPPPIPLLFPMTPFPRPPSSLPTLPGAPNPVAAKPCLFRVSQMLLRPIPHPRLRAVPPVCFRTLLPLPPPLVRPRA